MFIAVKNYGESENSRDTLCIFDTSDCTVECVQYVNIVEFIKSFNIRNLFYSGRFNIYEPAYYDILRSKYIPKYNSFVTYFDNTLSIGDRTPVIINRDKTLFMVNDIAIPLYHDADILYFFLFKDYLVLRCSCYKKFVELVYFTVLVSSDGDVDFYESDQVNRAKNKVIATQLEMTCRGI